MGDEKRQMKDRAWGELHNFQLALTLPAVNEAIRLLESEKFDQLASQQIRSVAEYQAVEVGGELFFDKAFTTGKEVAATLGYAKCLGREPVLDDLLRLRATLLGRSASFGAASADASRTQRLSQ